MSNKTNGLVDLWDNYAQAGYDNLYKSYSFQNILNIMGQMFEYQPASLVLDGGCGSGMVFSLISNKIKALKEALVSPLGIYYGMKLKNYAIKITEEAKKHGMKYPDKRNLDDLINRLGFNKLEEHKIFWDAGIAIKLQK